MPVTSGAAPRAAWLHSGPVTGASQRTSQGPAVARGVLGRLWPASRPGTGTRYTLPD